MGGSGTITSYGLSFRRYDTNAATWSNWTNDTIVNALTYSWTPKNTFVSLANRDLLQVKIKTNNNWNYSSSYATSNNLLIKNNIIYLYINGNPYEAETYLYIDGNPYEAETYIYIDGNPYESQ